MDNPSYFEEIETYQKHLDQQLRAPDGWLTLAGLHWLEQGTNRIGSDPSSAVPVPPYTAPQNIGNLTLIDGKVYFQPEIDAQTRINGEIISEKVQLQPDTDQNPTQVTLGDLTFFVIVRGDRVGVRVKQISHPNRLKFPGRVWWPIDEQYRVLARVEAYTPQKKVIIPDILGDENETGIDFALNFILDGQAHSLDAFGMASGQFYILFHDLSCGKGSYPAGRFLVTETPENQTVVIDFNKAYNPPCAFTPFATCPLPPKQNYLQTQIQAGERYRQLENTRH